MGQGVGQRPGSSTQSVPLQSVSTRRIPSTDNTVQLHFPTSSPKRLSKLNHFLHTLQLQKFWTSIPLTFFKSISMAPLKIKYT